jgi:hypothetical protein
MRGALFCSPLVGSGLTFYDGKASGDKGCSLFGHVNGDKEEKSFIKLSIGGNALKPLFSP